MSWQIHSYLLNCFISSRFVDFNFSILFSTFYSFLTGTCIPFCTKTRQSANPIKVFWWKRYAPLRKFWFGVTKMIARFLSKYFNYFMMIKHFWGTLVTLFRFVHHFSCGEVDGFVPKTATKTWEDYIFAHFLFRFSFHKRIL